MCQSIKTGCSVRGDTVALHNSADIAKADQKYQKKA